MRTAVILVCVMVCVLLVALVTEIERKGKDLKSERAKVSAYRDAVQSLNLLLTEAQGKPVPCPDGCRYEALEDSSAGFAFPSGGTWGTVVTGDSGTITSVPVFPRDSQSIGTERGR